LGIDAGTDRPGEAHREIEGVLLAETCAAHCVKDLRCQSWVLQQQINSCYLKEVSGTPFSDLRCTSGAVQLSLERRQSLATGRAAPRVWVQHGRCNPQSLQQSIEDLRPQGVFFVGRFMSESANLASEADVLDCSRMVDELWVPTPWHRALFAAQGVDVSKIYVVAEAVDTALFDPAAAIAAPLVPAAQGEESDDTRKSTLVRGATPNDQCVERGEGCGAGATATAASSGMFVFLSVFKWEYRKGWDILLQAYWSAFGPSDNTLLVLRCYKPSWEHGPEDLMHQLAVFAQWKFGKGLDKLAAVQWQGSAGGGPEEFTRSQLRSLLATADAFVLPSRGEGWGLPGTLYTLSYTLSHTLSHGDCQWRRRWRWKRRFSSRMHPGSWGSARPTTLSSFR
jgi:glycosyltransferase involved in cell wall biosynthesis